MINMSLKKIYLPGSIFKLQSGNCKEDSNLLFIFINSPLFKELDMYFMFHYLIDRKFFLRVAGQNTIYNFG